ncbi:hypothetical protein [Clostridium perfringens]|uniref:hypothetical protein n=1 Tax=Clostridium perfringens TaxID=1502 RepID=UPI001899C7F2|nr:hypothetical protein [Clostridium perfringens]
MDFDNRCSFVFSSNSFDYIMNMLGELLKEAEELVLDEGKSYKEMILIINEKSKRLEFQNKNKKTKE